MMAWAKDLLVMPVVLPVALSIFQNFAPRLFVNCQLANC